MGFAYPLRIISQETRNAYATSCTVPLLENLDFNVLGLGRRCEEEKACMQCW
jgi:hypothetical protein